MPRILDSNKAEPAKTDQFTFDVRASQRAIDRIKMQSNDERTKFILNTFDQFFGDQIEANPRAFAGRFRKMADSAFKFYRGSAILFYQDLRVDQDSYIVRSPAAGHIFIHGDLHAENFGAYLNDDGILQFDINDFDEGYVGPFTWDLKRLLASLYLICYAKGFSDLEIEQILRNCSEEYFEQVARFCQKPNETFALTMRTTQGKVLELLKKTRLLSHVDHLNSFTRIENYDRRLIRNDRNKDVDKETHNQLTQAFQFYLQTIPENKKFSDTGFNNGESKYKIKDITESMTVGIGSAGKISYLFLLEGRGETLENDLILSMKPAQSSALSHVVKHRDLEEYFKHDGLRIVLCNYAMNAAAPRWLGYTTMNSKPYIIDAVTAHDQGLNWSNINDLEDICQVVKYLGQLAAKIHCIADSDCIHTPNDNMSLPFSVIPTHTEKSIYDAVRGNENQFVKDMVEFGMTYGELVLRDHHLFVEALRNHRIKGIQ